MNSTYDVVIVGGGHNGMAAAIKLAQAGHSVLLLEAEAKSGGCATTTEPLLEGFRHNPHANTFLFADLMPEDIAPASLGVRILQPAAQLGVAFADGRPPVILHRPDLLDQTGASLSVYSRSDARTYAQLKTRSAGLGALIKQGLYAAPNSVWFEAQRDTIRRAFRNLYDPDKRGGDTARALIDTLFNAPEVRILLYCLALETGVALDEPGGDVAFLGYSIWIAGRWRIPIGGMQTYADALYRKALEAGVGVETSECVTRIVVEAGRAVGVDTSTGKRHGASKAVLAATPILHVFDELLDSRAISPAEQAELSLFRRTVPTSIGTSVYCLDRAPRYKSARHDAGIDACLKTVIGYQSPSDVLEQGSDILAGRLPRPAGVVRIHSLWDESLAPGLSHLAGVDSAFPAISRIDDDTWGLVDASFPTAFFDTWRDHISPDHVPTVLATGFDRSSAFERRMMLRTGSDQYRTSIDRLYLGGPGVYPGGGVHGACGRNAAQTMLADLETPVSYLINGMS